jgi:hypothetical protein
MRTVRTPVHSQVEQQYTVMVPFTEKRQGMRTVGRCVPVVKRTTVCEDQGHWEQQAVACGGCAPAAVACGGCATACVTSCAPVTRCVWVPNIVQREVEFTVQEWQTSQEPYEYDFVNCRPEVRQRMVDVCRIEVTQVPCEYEVTTFRREPRVCQRQICEMQPTREVRQVGEQVCVPRTRMEDYQVTTCETVVEDVREEVKVCVPVVSEREVPVQVCRMVERKIMVPAPSCCAAVPACASCGPVAGCCQ